MCALTVVGDTRIGGDFERDQLPARAEEPIVVEEVAAPGDELRLEAGREVRPGTDGDVGRLAPEDGGRLAKRLPTSSELHDPNPFGGSRFVYARQSTEGVPLWVPS